MVEVNRDKAEKLLTGLVSIPSLSGDEGAASRWLVTRMAELKFDRAYVDDAGNAVGEFGEENAERSIVLLGHIDTVPGEIPVRIEPVATDDGMVPHLFGRGSVDAKGPLATFVLAAARLGREWASESRLRVIVVGAVEEESATSRGARAILDRFPAAEAPDACIIGEPSGWNRVTLGYKGRLLLDLECSQPMAHTAGPDPGVAVAIVNFWNWLEEYVARANEGCDRLFDQILPSLRKVQSWTSDAMDEHVSAKIGIRLPPHFELSKFQGALARWAEIEAGGTCQFEENDPILLSVPGERRQIELRLYGHEPAWRSSNQGALPRAFRSAIRSVGSVRPGFLVKTGTSDMNVVGPVWGCPMVAYGPGDSSLDHTPNENLNLDEYWTAIQVLEAALRRLALDLN